MIKDIFLILLIIFSLNGCEKKSNTIPLKEKVEEIKVIDNLTYEFNEKINISDIINEEVEGIIDTTKLGNNEILIKNYKINYNVIDTTPPLIKGSSTITIEKGKKTNLINKFICGDEYDSNPNCYIEGEYDINKTGTYNLKYVAIDSSNNKTDKTFKLVVKNPTKSEAKTSAKKTNISKYIKKYKNENTLIGIDVSAWQSDINWKKVASNGVEAAMIRIGYGPSDNKLKLDSKFEKNIKEAKENNIKVGIYFYSYAKTKEEVIEEVNWIINKLNGQNLDLPIAFDWENWSKFNTYHVSFYELNNMAQTFINEVEKNGYKGMIYSSAYYLNHIWYKNEFKNTWLAYYTNNNDYSGDYNIWQLTSTGGIDGINGYVDIDIFYKGE